jgi:hypothetical protein
MDNMLLVRSSPYPLKSFVALPTFHYKLAIVRNNWYQTLQGENRTKTVELTGDGFDDIQKR